MIYFLKGVCTVFVVIFYLILLIASFVVAMTISNMIGGLNGYVWWCFTIVIFALISKILFYNNDSDNSNSSISNYYDDFYDNFDDELI